MLFNVFKGENQMIIVEAKIRAKNGNRDKIISKSEDLIKSTRLESGCISYNLYASVEDDDILIMFEKWENMDILNKHMKTEHFKAFGDAIEEFLAENMNINIYSVERFP